MQINLFSDACNDICNIGLLCMVDLPPTTRNKKVKALFVHFFTVPCVIQLQRTLQRLKLQRKSFDGRGKNYSERRGTSHVKYKQFVACLLYVRVVAVIPFLRDFHFSHFSLKKVAVACLKRGKSDLATIPTCNFLIQVFRSPIEFNRVTTHG